MTESGKRQVLVAATLDFGSVAAQGNAVLTVSSNYSIPVGSPVVVGVPSPAFGGVQASGTLTLDTIPTDADTTEIGSRTYTWEDTLTDVDGNIYTGGSLAQAKLNLLAALDLSGVAGTDYATSMTANTEVTAAAFVVNDSVFTAVLAGVAGNSLASVQSVTGSNAFSAATLLGGEDSSELSVDAWVSAQDVVSVRVTNASAAAVDPPSGEYKFLVWI